MKYRLRSPRPEDTSHERLTGELQALLATYGAYPGISSDLRRLLGEASLAPSPGSPDGREAGSE